MASFFNNCYLRLLFLRLNTYMGLLIKNIKGLVQVEDDPKLRVCGKEMSLIDTVSDAYLYLERDLISDFGPMRFLDSNPGKIDLLRDIVIDASGKFVFPSFCDSHTHLVYAGSREGEFTDKIRGLSYEEIAKNRDAWIEAWTEAMK